MKGVAVTLCLAALLLLPLSAGAGSVKEPSGPATQAVMLDHNEYPCVNCLFGISDYYFCFDAGGKILIGHEKIRTQMRRHEPADLMERGKTVSIKYDTGYIWVPQAKGKDLRLTQDYTKKIFLENDRCLAAAK
jgi:hypothetical protein